MRFSPIETSLSGKSSENSPNTIIDDGAHALTAFAHITRIIDSSIRRFRSQLYEWKCSLASFPKRRGKFTRAWKFSRSICRRENSLWPKYVRVPTFNLFHIVSDMIFEFVINMSVIPVLGKSDVFNWKKSFIIKKN